MTESMDVFVSELKPDFFFTGMDWLEYVQVSFSHRIPVPMSTPPPAVLALMAQPPPKPGPVYKHVLHLFIPKDKWAGQYNMWQQFHLITKDDGSIELRKVET